MNSEPINYKKTLLTVLIVTSAIFASILFGQWYASGYNWAFLSKSKMPAVKPTDTSIAQEDSVRVANGKIPSKLFHAQYDTDTWFSEYYTNKVRFDKTYDNQKIDIYGEIKSIEDHYGCSEIILATHDNNYEISFYNCPEGQDRWSKEVENVSVGNIVHIRGYYSGYSSSRYIMHLYKCHIIED